MAGLMSRGAILTFSRLSNFAIHLFSPLLLVRVLDVASYGQYQEFMIYAALLTTLCTFSLDSSLLYFLSRSPERERQIVSQTSAITLVLSIFTIGLLLLARPVAVRFLTFDFIIPLAAYVFVFVNLNWLESYWIAKRRPHAVLVYTVSRLIVRLGVLLTVAYLTKNVESILWSLVVVEGLRVAIVLAYFLRKNMFLFELDRSTIREQVGFAFPIGASAFVQNASRSVGKIVVSGSLGPTALAYYVTGSYLQPVVRVARSGIEDAIYPELVRAHGQPRGAVRLWQRVNVLNCVMFFPAFVLLIVYSRELVGLLFTAEYLPAVPVFNVYALFLLRRCFNTDVLLRTSGRSGFMLWGTIGALVCNTLLILALGKSIGLVGPAVAFIAAEVLLEAYYLFSARRHLGLGLSELIDWRSIAKVAGSCVAGLPVLIAFSWLRAPELIVMVIASILYFALVLFIAFRPGVSDVGKVVDFVLSRFRKLKLG
jgi:O-antigen/teichoic acid export membrane protein